jgi:hypothetical protein
MPSSPAYLNDLDELFSFTAGERRLLYRNGFFVTERLRYGGYGQAMIQLWRADMPLFVSTDAILHALHMSYVTILATIEESYLMLELDAGLDAVHDGCQTLNTIYTSSPGMRPSLDDVDVFLTVARSLLSGETTPSLGGNDALVQQILGYVAAERPVQIALFNEAKRIYDFSQFKPRGHYADSEALSRYFQAMMWLGRTEFRFTPPPGNTDVSREIVDAFLLLEAGNQSGGWERIDNMDRVIEALVGSEDNLTIVELEELKTAIGLAQADELLDEAVMSNLRNELAAGGYSPQAINSQILMSFPLHPEDLDPPYAFMFLGQRFIVDSFIFSNVVYDRIEYEGTKPFRELPSPLDALYALGNDDVLPLLREELETAHYSANLSALRFLIDGYDSAYWGTSLYASWLNAIRTLALSGRDPRVPPFMKTGAWQQQKMNSQLTSWAELRHDNLLYAKQSYTMGYTCSFPCTYVEPIPEFYRVLGEFASRAGLRGHGIDDGHVGDGGGKGVER